MQVNLSAIGLVVCGFLASSWSAPLQHEESEDIAIAPPVPSENGHMSQIIEQEKELEKLASLAAQNHEPVQVEESHSMTYNNNNGKESSVQNNEKTVLNPVNDKLVGDIMQTITHPENGKSKIETEIDVPEEGVHQQFVDPAMSELDETSPDESDLREDTIEFTPPNVALYLAKTGAFDQFQEALEELVNNSMMTPQEAERYENEVFDQYTRLVQNVEQDLQYPDVDPYYGYPYETPEFPEREEYIPVDEDMLYAQYAMPDYGETYSELTKDEGRALVNDAISRDETLDMMIKNMIDEWITREVVNENNPIDPSMTRPEFDPALPIDESLEKEVSDNSESESESEEHTDDMTKQELQVDEHIDTITNQESQVDEQKNKSMYLNPFD
ncbi:hypothetical protein ScPMuIL_003272 [Solemya velum]